MKIYKIISIALLLSISWVFPQNHYAVESAEQTVKKAVPDNRSSDVRKKSATPSASTEKTQAAPKKQPSLKSLVDAPFEQLRQSQQNLSDEIPADISTATDVSQDGNGSKVKLPSIPEQQRKERELQQKVDTLLRELLPDKYVGITVSMKYLLHTLPISKTSKQISKLKLPGFENNVWLPVETKNVVGIVNRILTHSVIFVVVNSPVSPFNVEVLRQKLSEKIIELDLNQQDVLKVVYIPSARTVEEIKDATVAQDGTAKEEQTKESQKKEKQTKEPQKEGVPVEEMKLDLETSKYLLQAREAYFQNDLNQAMDSIHKAIALNPTSAQSYEMLGSIYYRLKWHRLAVKNWKKALELDPSNQTLVKYLNRVESQ